MANAGAPQTESKNVMCVDYANNNALKELFARKNVGQKCKLTVEAHVMNKTPDGATLAIDKIITEDFAGGDEEMEITPNNDEPVMMSMKRRRTPEPAPKVPETKSVAQPTANSQGFTSYA